VFIADYGLKDWYIPEMKLNIMEQCNARFITGISSKIDDEVVVWRWK